MTQQAKPKDAQRATTINQEKNQVYQKRKLQIRQEEQQQEPQP